MEIDKILMMPWGHQKYIIDKCVSIDQALFYINKTIENNWSRSILEYHIETDLYNRQGKAITNFSLTLPEPQSDLANEIMKSSYNFEFLRLSEKTRETDVEKALVNHSQIGISTYHFTELTDEMKSALPSDETLQHELENFERIHAKS